MLKKTIWANFQRIVEVFTQKFSICSQIYGFGIRDPRSGIQGSKRHRVPDPGSATLQNTLVWIWIRKRSNDVRVANANPNYSTAEKQARDLPGMLLSTFSRSK